MASIKPGQLLSTTGKRIDFIYKYLDKQSVKSVQTKETATSTDDDPLGKS